MRATHPDHCSFRLALLPFPTKPAVGRGDAAEAWHGRVLWDDPPVGRKFEPDYAWRLRPKQPRPADIRHRASFSPRFVAARLWCRRPKQERSSVVRLQDDINFHDFRQLANK